MTIREAQKQQRESMKDRSFREKLSYFWEYHGIKTIGLLLAVIAVIAFIVTMVTKKDYAFTGIFFGAISQDSADSYLTDFGQSAGIDPKEYEGDLSLRGEFIRAVMGNAELTDERKRQMITLGLKALSGRGVDA